MVDKKLIINDVYIAEYSMHLARFPEVPTPEQDIEYVNIRGRHGNLTKKYAFKDIPYSLEFFFFDDAPFKTAFRQVKLILFQARKMLITDDETVFYKVKSVNIMNAENEVAKFGRFIVNFTLDPFQYEVQDSTQTITSRTTLTNPGHESQPIITATVAGTGRIYINDQEIVIQDINGTIIIDSELMNAYRNNNGIITNLNKHMIGDFPIFKNGNNVIDFDGDITKLEVNPRWRWV